MEIHKGYKNVQNMKDVVEQRDKKVKAKTHETCITPPSNE